MTPGDYVNLTKENLSYVDELGPHTRKHALQLLTECPGTLRITSGYRSTAKNRRVGGVPNSLHLKRRAIDLAGDAHTLPVAAGRAWALRMGPVCTGPEEVLLEHLGQPGQHLHVAW